MKFQQEYEVAKATTGGGGKTLDISKKNKGKVTSNNNLHSPEKRMKRSKLVQQANQRIGRCMNLIRFVTEHEYFVGKNVAIIEQCVKPLLQFADRPEEIDFEDDLIFCIDALIKKSRSCSPMMQELFPYVQKFQMKYNGVLANLVDGNLARRPVQTPDSSTCNCRTYPGHVGSSLMPNSGCAQQIYLVLQNIDSSALFSQLKGSKADECHKRCTHDDAI